MLVSLHKIVKDALFFYKNIHEVTFFPYIYQWESIIMIVTKYASTYIMNIMT